MKYRVHGFALLLTAAALLFGAAPASAQFGRNQVKYEDFDFKILNTPHWDLYFYSEEEEAMKDFARMSERWYERFARSFQHEFEQTKPIIVYADHPDFEQTSTLPASNLDQGIGGVTESIKNRVIMPMTGSYRDTDHVLGHELVHAFQYNIAQSRRGGGFQGLGNLPGWLVEGMAEYFSLGRESSLTGMWLRGALREGDFPTIKDLTSGQKYFPYRFGQGLWAYVGGTYGDDAVVQLYRRSLRIGFGPAIEQVLGVDQDTLSAQWKRSVERAYLPLMVDRTPPDSTGTVILSPKTEGGKINVGPALSPDGRFIAYISEKDIFSIELYLADAKTGKTIRKLSDATTNPHYDALRYIESAGTFSPDGKYFAYAVTANGDQQIVIVESENGNIWRIVQPIPNGGLNNPAWSPDGQTIAFSGTVGGFSDLYLYDVETQAVKQLTNDKNGDFHPDWSPDGGTIAFSSDRGPETDFDDLVYSEYVLAFYDMASGRVTAPDILGNVRQSNPQYAPDGSVYFISDADGFTDVYRYQPNDGSVTKITNIATGISGFTTMGPALSVADKTGELAFTVFSNLGEFHISTLPASPTGTPFGKPTAEQMAARNLPPLSPDRFSVVAEYLADEKTGLPADGAYDPATALAYEPSLALDYVGQPSLGVGNDGFGNYVGGGASAYFSDMLGDKVLATAIQAQGSVKDIGGQVFYADLGDRWNWAVGLSHIPYMISYISQGSDPDGSNPYLGQILDRLYVSSASAQVSYPFSVSRRFEAQGGFTRYASNQQIQKFYVDQFGRCCIRQEQEDLPSRFDPLDLVNGSLGLVFDNSYMGLTSPVRGGRSRYEVGGTVGTINYLTVVADWRRYFGLNRNLTFATRALHYGQYGNLIANVDQQVLQPSFLGYEWFIRGYDYSSFTPEECTASASSTGGSCPVRNRLFGHKLGVMSAEFRVPLLGVEEYGMINFPFVPTELVAFADGGVAWDSHLRNADGSLEMSDEPVLEFARNSIERVPVFSTGVGARFNVLGFMVLEAYYVYPWQRPDKGAHWGFQIAPGW